MRCISCKKQAESGVIFPCPECKKQLFRCNKCRNLSIEYKCECGFKGP